jgi:hypothetical protein
MGDKTFPATVIKVIDAYRVVINKGSRDGINIGQRFQIYAETDELLQDPVTLESLGNLEISRGTGKVIYVQEKWATIGSDRTRAPNKKIVTRTRNNPTALGVGGISGYFASTPVEVEETIETPGEQVPFDHPSDGDKVKPI